MQSWSHQPAQHGHPRKVFDIVSVAGKGEGLTITPFAAGHLIGGSIWRISTAVGEDVVYAVDYNHRKELHLNSTALAGLFSRPALMIADADRYIVPMNTLMFLFPFVL